MKQMQIDVKRMGLAVGATSALLYLGCALVMATTSTKTAVLFFNSVMHGLNVAPIMRPQTGILEMCLGILEIFILGWVVGALIAKIYNVTAKAPAADAESSNPSSTPKAEA